MSPSTVKALNPTLSSVPSTSATLSPLKSPSQAPTLSSSHSTLTSPLPLPPLSLMTALTSPIPSPSTTLPSILPPSGLTSSLTPSLIPQASQAPLPFSFMSSNLLIQESSLTVPEVPKTILSPCRCRAVPLRKMISKLTLKAPCLFFRLTTWKTATFPTKSPSQQRRKAVLRTARTYYRRRATL